MVAGFALAGYIVVTFNPAALWNPQTWWQSIAVWLAAAILVHDLALFPLYALADKCLGAVARRMPRRRRRQLRVPARNYLRIPTLGSGLTLLMFFPAIIRQGSATYLAATGETQQPFLGRWLLFTAAVFLISAVCYVLRLATAHYSSGTSRSISSSQVRADMSDGARQSPRGDSDPPCDTFGPFGNADRLNWLNE